MRFAFLRFTWNHIILNSSNLTAYLFSRSHIPAPISGTNPVKECADTNRAKDMEHSKHKTVSTFNDCVEIDND